MYVCICNAVTEKQILDTVKSGETSLREISRRFGLGSSCGKCLSTARELLNETLGKDSNDTPKDNVSL